MFRRSGAISRTLQAPGVRPALAHAGRSVEDLRELQDRLIRSGVERERVSSALANAELIAWFFSLPSPDRISFDDSMC